MTVNSSTPTLAMTFSGGAAVVTGAASGIGAAITAVLRSAGVRTVGVDLHAPTPDPAHPAHLQIAVAANVCDPDFVARLADAGVPPDAVSYVVNCAGVCDNTGFNGIDRAAWARMLDVNLFGAYNVIDALSSSLRCAPWAAVVNVSSIEAAHVVALANPDPTPHYAASKAGLHMLTKTAARALATDDVRVNSVSPGFVATPMTKVHGLRDALAPAQAARVPMGRLAEPSDIAAAVAFLLSDQAGFITGSDLRVDGGFQLT